MKTRDNKNLLLLRVLQKDYIKRIRIIGREPGK